MNIDEMMFNTKDILTMLRNNDYRYVFRRYWSPELRAYKSDYDVDDSLDISFLDNSFFQKYVGKREVREIDNLLGKYQDYCNEQENKDSEFIKFIKTEVESIVDLFKRKSKAYGSNEDVFHNFRQSARRIYNDDSVNSMFMIAETLKDKHNVALAKGADVPECAERLRDNIVYSLIQLSMLKEMQS